MSNLYEKVNCHCVIDTLQNICFPTRVKLLRIPPHHRNSSTLNAGIFCTFTGIFENIGPAFHCNLIQFKG